MLDAVPRLLNGRHRGICINMARAGTVAQLTGRVIGIAILLVRPRSVVVRVTAGAIRLQGRQSPVNNFSVGLVAVGVGAIKVIAVIQWLIRQTRVSVIGWRPRIWAVAQTAVLRRIKVSRVLASRQVSIVAG